MNTNKIPEKSGNKQEKIGRGRSEGSRATQFKPGQSGNPAGRPIGSNDPVKEIAKKIAEKRIATGMTVKQRRALEKAGFNLEEVTVVEMILTDWATSRNVNKQEKFIERYAGKVANVNVNQNSSFDFMKHASRFTDGELEQIKNGADPLDLFSSKIPDVETVDEVLIRIKNGEDAVKVLKELIPGIFGGTNEN